MVLVARHQTRAPTPKPTRTRTPTPTSTPTPTQSGTPPPTPTQTGTPQPTPTIIATPTFTVLATPTDTPQPSQAATPSPTPTASPSPTSTPTAGAGNTYYVATTGSDSNSGTSRDSAWRTIQHAAASLQPGDTAIVMAGTYAERVKVSNSGTSGALLTFLTDPDAQVVTNGFEVSGNYVQIAGFEITNQFTTEPSGYMQPGRSM